MTARPVPQRQWRSYGNDPLPSGAEALEEPFNAFRPDAARPASHCAGGFAPLRKPAR
jgi:hypothetical protein